MGVLSRQLFVLVLMRGGVMPQFSGPFRVAFCLLEFISRRSDLKPLEQLPRLELVDFRFSPFLNECGASFSPPFCGGCVSGFL